MNILTALLALILGGNATTATRYADTPRDEGGTPACARRIARDDYRRLHSIRCAHRTIPCGTVLRVWSPSTGRVATCAVLDRGPWGLRQRARGIRARTESPAALLRLARRDPGAFRGDLDISPVPARALGLTLHVGRMPVVYWPAGQE